MAELPQDSSCPDCGEEPTEESIVYSRLSDNGYKHRDVRLECSECETKWVHGIPRGETETEKWVCEICGGDYIPHFLFVNTNPNERTIKTRPKCKACFHVPEERIELDSTFNGENIRGFIGHHTVTGDRTKESESEE